MTTEYRTHATILERLEKLEAVKKAAEEFLLALHTNPFRYPSEREEVLCAAIRETYKAD